MAELPKEKPAAGSAFLFLPQGGLCPFFRGEEGGSI
jgi:hypothetical protein